MAMAPITLRSASLVSKAPDSDARLPSSCATTVSTEREGSGAGAARRENTVDRTVAAVSDALSSTIDSARTPLASASAPLAVAALAAAACQRPHTHEAPCTKEEQCSNAPDGTRPASRLPMGAPRHWPPRLPRPPPPPPLQPLQEPEKTHDLL